MIKYLQIEYMKIKGNSSFKVFTLLFLIMMPIIVIVLPSYFKDGLFGMGMDDSYPFMPRTASSTWYYTTYIASWFSFYLLTFIIIFHITNEYAAKTVRQNIIDGYSKMDYLKSKIGMVIFMATTATIYVFLIGLVANLYFKSNQPDPSTNLAGLAMMMGEEMPSSASTSFGDMSSGLLFVLGFYIQILAYFIVAVLISMLVRKGALAVLLFFGVFFLEMIVRGVLSSQGHGAIAEYFPLHSFSALLPNFEWKFLLLGLGEMGTLTLTTTLVSVGYIILFVWLTKIIFYKRDVV